MKLSPILASLKKNAVRPSAFLCTAAIAIGLYAADVSVNGRIPVTHAQASSASFHPEVRIQFTHLCCSGCSSDLEGNLRQRFSAWLDSAPGHPVSCRLPGGKALLPTAGRPIIADYSGELVLAVRRERISFIEFNSLNKALRERGVKPRSVRLCGVNHFRLTAYVPYLCCPGCREALEAQFSVRKGLQAGSQSLLPHLVGQPEIDAQSRQVSAEFENEADVTLFVEKIERTGFEPTDLTVTLLERNN